MQTNPKDEMKDDLIQVLQAQIERMRRERTNLTLAALVAGFLVGLFIGLAADRF